MLLSAGHRGCGAQAPGRRRSQAGRLGRLAPDRLQLPIDAQLHPPDRQEIDLGLGPAGLDLLADPELPLPDAGNCRLGDGELDAPVYSWPSPRFTSITENMLGGVIFQGKAKSVGKPRIAHGFLANARAPKHAKSKLERRRRRETRPRGSPTKNRVPGPGNGASRYAAACALLGPMTVNNMGASCRAFPAAILISCSESSSPD
jgi:hypothetical protein